ncbi:MAG: DUF6873 family GME fold protein [Anaerovoracaceae bacterium]|jgi:hypothetical protein
MSIIYVSENAYDAVISHIRSMGHEAELTVDAENLSAPVASHADLRFCRLGIAPGAPVYAGDPGSLGPVYPGDVRFCAACTGRYVICNARYTDPGLLSSAEAAGMELVDVKQGYAKCNTLIVDEESIITSDQGISRACEKAGLAVLTVHEGHITLPGYDHGFIGGASGRIGREIIFNGDVTAHPDYPLIRRFITERGLLLTWFDGLPLADIGSIV